MRAPLKVCHIISGDLWAGAEVMAYHLLNGLREFPDLELSAIVLNEGKLAEEIKRLDIPCHIIDESKLSFPRILLKSSKILKQSPVHILHSHRYKENILSYLLSKTIKGFKLVSTQHGMPEEHDGRTNPLNRLKIRLNNRLLSHAFHAVAAVSRDMEESLMRDYGFKAGNLTVIHNGIALPQHSLRRDKPDLLVFGSAGRFFPVKDYPLMVEIAREVAKSSSNARFVLAGEGPDRDHLQQLIKRYGLENVFQLPGFVQDMDAFYRGLHIYLNTSLHEGIPMSILEAMAYGLPAIAPGVGGLKEIITDKLDGYLVEGRNPLEFAEICLMLIADEKLRHTVGEKAREKMEQSFSYQSMAKSYYVLYEGLPVP